MLKFTRINKKKKGIYSWENAPDVRKRAISLKNAHKIGWIKTKSIHFVRSKNSKARAYARIWGLPKIWRDVLKISPTYIIEVLSEKYDKLSDVQKNNVLIHEIAHIPKNFSGSLVPHFKKGKRSFDKRIRGIKDKI